MLVFHRLIIHITQLFDLYQKMLILKQFHELFIIYYLINYLCININIYKSWLIYYLLQKSINIINKIVFIFTTTTYYQKKNILISFYYIYL